MLVGCCAAGAAASVDAGRCTLSVRRGRSRTKDWRRLPCCLRRTGHLTIDRARQVRSAIRWANAGRPPRGWRFLGNVSLHHPTISGRQMDVLQVPGTVVVGPYHRERRPKLGGRLVLRAYRADTRARYDRRAAKALDVHVFGAEVDHRIRIEQCLEPRGLQDVNRRCRRANLGESGGRDVAQDALATPSGVGINALPPLSGSGKTRNTSPLWAAAPRVRTRGVAVAGRAQAPFGLTVRGNGAAVSPSTDCALHCRDVIKPTCSVGPGPTSGLMKWRQQ